LEVSVGYIEINRQENSRGKINDGIPAHIASVTDSKIGKYDNVMM